MMADESEDHKFIDSDHEREKENLNEKYTNNHNDADDEIDSELEEINIRVKEIEKEAEKLKEIQSKVEDQLNLLPSLSPLSSPSSSLLSEKFPMNTMMAFQSHDKEEIDSRSIYVGNVDYGASAEELEKHFHQCGMINRVTILCDKVDGHSKGFAYIEFSSKEFVENALKMNETIFHGRQIRVMAKRTNRPGYSRIKNFIPKRYSVHSRNAYGSFGIINNGYSNICGPFKHSKWSLKAGYDFSNRHFPY